MCAAVKRSGLRDMEIISMPIISMEETINIHCSAFIAFIQTIVAWANIGDLINLTTVSKNGNQTKKMETDWSYTQKPQLALPDKQQYGMLENMCRGGRILF